MAGARKGSEPAFGGAVSSLGSAGEAMVENLRDGSPLTVQQARPVGGEGERTVSARTPDGEPTTGERMGRELTLIAEIGRIIGSSLDIDEVYERFAAEVRKLLPFHRLSVTINNLAEGTVRIAHVSGSPLAGRIPGHSIPLAESLNQMLMQTRTGCLVLPARAEELVGRYPALMLNFSQGERSMMSVPLIRRDEVIGALHFRSKQPNAYCERDLALAERVGEQIAGAIANARLYTDLKETERSLRESEARFRAIFEQAAVGVAEIDAATGRYLAVNHRQCEILGMTPEEMLATTFLEVTHPDDRHLHIEQTAQLKAGKIDNATLEKRCVRKDGAVIWVNVAVSPLGRQGEHPFREIVVMEDISARKDLERELRTTLDRLEWMVRERTIELEETNTALKVLLRKRAADQKALGEKLDANVRQLVLPFVGKLKALLTSRQSQTYLSIIETNLSEIVSPLISQLSAAFKKLTPTEAQIAELIRQGKNSKEIAEMFGSTVATINTHRNNIRRKLELKKKKTNLRSYLLSLS